MSAGQNSSPGGPEILTPEMQAIAAALKPILMEVFRDFAAATDRKSTRLNSSHIQKSRMPSSA